MISDKSVSRILKELGYSLQANRKKIVLSGNGSREKRAERDLQFRHIVVCVKALLEGENRSSVSIQRRRNLSVTSKNPAAYGATSPVMSLITISLPMLRAR